MGGQLGVDSRPMTRLVISTSAEGGDGRERQMLLQSRHGQQVLTGPRADDGTELTRGRRRGRRAAAACLQVEGLGGVVVRGLK